MPMGKKINSKLAVILLVIFVAALALRLCTVFAQRQYELPPGQDGKLYDNIGLNIASGKGYVNSIGGSPAPTAHRPPMYPLFLAGIYLVFGHSYLAVHIVQAVIGALLCVVVFFITRLVYGNNKEAVIASALTAAYKPFIWGFNYYGGPAYLLTEYLFMFILGCMIWSLLLYMGTGKRGFAVLSGVLMGAAVLTRSEFIIYPLLLALYLFCTCRFSVKKFFMKYFLIYVFIMLTVAPWTIRNYAVFKKVIPLSNSRGLAFLCGNNPSARGSLGIPENFNEIAGRGPADECSQDRIYMQEALRYIKANPGRSAALLFRKTAVHWMPFEKGWSLFNPYYAFALVFALIGIAFYRRRVITEGIIIILFFQTALTAMLTFGEPRYRYPYEVFLLIFAAHALNSIFKILKKT